MAARSRTSTRRNSNPGCDQAPSSEWPPCSRESATRTWWPSWSSSGTSVDPTYPAPPVTRMRMSEPRQPDVFLRLREVVRSSDVEPVLEDREGGHALAVGEQPVDQVGHVEAFAPGNAPARRRLQHVDPGV